MTTPTNPLELLWDALLSRQPEKVRAAFNNLDPNSQRSVRIHLERMVSEPGWHPEQVKSAKAALTALESQ